MVNALDLPADGPASFRVETRSGRVTWSPGIRPMNPPAPRARRRVNAATFHHVPSRQPSGDGVGVTTAVHVARALFDAGMDAEAAAIDLEHLEDLGVAYRVHVRVYTDQADKALAVPRIALMRDRTWVLLSISIGTWSLSSLAGVSAITRDISKRVASGPMPPRTPTVRIFVIPVTELLRLELPAFPCTLQSSLGNAFEQLTNFHGTTSCARVPWYSYIFSAIMLLYKKNSFHHAYCF